jgi:hypothetical protein
MTMYLAGVGLNAILLLIVYYNKYTETKKVDITYTMSEMMSDVLIYTSPLA